MFCSIITCVLGSFCLKSISSQCLSCLCDAKSRVWDQKTNVSRKRNILLTIQWTITIVLCGCTWGSRYPPHPYILILRVGIKLLFHLCCLSTPTSCFTIFRSLYFRFVVVILFRCLGKLGIFSNSVKLWYQYEPQPWVKWNTKEFDRLRFPTWVYMLRVH